MEDTSLEQTEICQMSQLGFVALTELPEIITYRVFEYLEDTELDVCRQVCTEWRDIADRIMYHKVTMIKREIPFNLVNSINCESDKVRPYTGFDHNFQYNWFYLAQKPETTSNSLHMDDESKDIRNRHLQNHDTEMHDEEVSSRACRACTNDIERISTSFNFSSAEETTEIHLSIFPNISGFTVTNYPLDLSESELFVYDILPNNSNKLTEHLCHKANISVEETKCVLLYKDVVAYSYEKKLNSTFSYPKEIYVNRFTLFHGQKVNAFSVCIDHENSDYKNVKEKFQKVKSLKPRIIQKKCFVYFFHRVCNTCFDPLIRAFRDSFPVVNYVTIERLPIYLSVNPPENNYFCEENKTFPEYSCLALFTFVWWD